MGLIENPITVVIVAYGSDQQFADCLEALGSEVPVVVVDNGGSDGACRICAAAGATYVRPPRNIGFAAAVNLALREHRDRGSDVLLLNPDARLLPADLSILRDELRRRQDLAAVGPRLVNTDGSAQKAQWPIPSPWAALAAVVGVADRLARRRFVSGAVLLLRGDAIDTVGSLDERFFLYAEETDWQMRALRAGWRVKVVSDAKAEHISGGTSSDAARREFLFNTSAELFVRKWYGSRGWQVFRMASILAAARRLALSHDRQMRATQRRVIAHYWRGLAPRADAITRSP